MKYLLIQCFCVINMYFKTLKFSSIIDHNLNSPNIDDFIRQLLTSQKFDELADKIADKAVDKIIKFEQGSQATDIKLKSNLSNKNTSKLLENLHKHQDKQVKRVESDGENTKQNDEKKQNNKIGKINMQAFMKKDASLKSENLSLKYKYLTQKANKKTHTQEDNQVHKEKRHKQPDDGSMVLRNNENLEKTSQKYSNYGKESPELDEIENKSQDYEEIARTSNENSLDKSLIAVRDIEEDKEENYHDENVMTNIYHKDVEYDDYKNLRGHSDNDEGEDEQDYEKSKTDHENDGKNIMRFSDVRQKVENNTTTTLHYDNKTNEYAKLETTSKSNKIKEKDVETSDHEEDQSKDYEDSDENKVTTQDIRNNTLNRVRSEGNKQFKFQSSPEYNDYLEEYDKVRKDNPEKDFL